MDPKSTDTTSQSPWTKSVPPEKILVIRFHAAGDVAITLPACNSLRKLLPYAKIDFLTDGSAKDIPNSFAVFDNVYSLPDLCTIDTGYQPKLKNKIKRLYRATRLSSKLRKIKYDMVIDLQNNRTSHLVRKIISPKSWSEFNRFEPKPAGVRVLETFHRAGLDNLELTYDLPIKLTALQKAEMILTENGWNKNRRLIVLNPAGLWKTRNWPIENYVELAKLLFEEEPSQFLLLGTDRMSDKADFIKTVLGENVINIVKKTKIDEILGILKYVSLVVSEDSGLMHMSWVSGVPTIALLGSSRSDWTMPLGEHTRCLNSSDLPCGNCMKPECIYGDVHCLTRYTPEMILNLSRELLSSRKLAERVI